MTDTTREAVARAIYDEIEGPVNNQDFTRQTRQWELAQRLADAALAALRPAQDAEGWRDIEIDPPPHNHFPMLVWSEKLGQLVAFRDVTWAWWPYPAYASLSSAPTHWMPLPASPPRTLEGK